MLSIRELQLENFAVANGVNIQKLLDLWILSTYSNALKVKKCAIPFIEFYLSIAITYETLD